MLKLLKLLKQYKAFISYVFFGLCTTGVNLASYYVLYKKLSLPNLVSVVIAWLLAVSFAFITNKLYVFDSKSFQKNRLVYEILTFFACRLLTGVMDVGIMYVAVDLLKGKGILWKAISNVLTIIINYIASKVVIFKKEKVYVDERKSA